MAGRATMTGARGTAVERTYDCPWNLFSELRRQVSQKGAIFGSLDCLHQDVARVFIYKVQA